MVKTTQENLNNSLKRSILLEHELETERLNKSMMKLKLDSFITTMNKCDNKNNNDDSKCDVNVILQNHVHLTNKMNEIQVGGSYISIFIFYSFIHLNLFNIVT